MRTPEIPFCAGRYAAALLVLAGCGPGPGSEAGLRSTIASYDSAWVARDTAAVERLLAPDYVYFTSSGRLSSRAESVELLRDTGYVLTSWQRSKVRVTLSGDAARVSSRWEGTGRFRNESVRDDQTCGQTWLWRGGHWTLFTEHCVNLPQRDTTGGAG